MKTESRHIKPVLIHLYKSKLVVLSLVTCAAFILFSVPIAVLIRSMFNPGPIMSPNEISFIAQIVVSTALIVALLFSMVGSLSVVVKQDKLKFVIQVIEYACFNILKALIGISFILLICSLFGMEFRVQWPAVVASFVGITVCLLQSGYRKLKHKTLK